jgi:hypothetical protein
MVAITTGILTDILTGGDMITGISLTDHISKMFVMIADNTMHGRMDITNIIGKTTTGKPENPLQMIF